MSIGVISDCTLLKFACTVQLSKVKFITYIRGLMFIYMTIASVDLPTPFLLLGALAGHTVHNSVLLCTVIKVTIQFERRFRLMEHISVIS